MWRVGIDELAERLGAITFFAGAGTYADKTTRLVGARPRARRRRGAVEAARLAKADQASELVREFPELEGHIGAEYARLAGYPEAVCAAIEEQYLPDAAEGRCRRRKPGGCSPRPTSSTRWSTAFGLGHKPTGSRDPYALRRAAIGLCRLAIEGGLADRPRRCSRDVRDFVEERLEGLLDVPVEAVRAAVRSPAPDLGTVAALAEHLAALDDAALEPAHTAFTRAQRIAAKAEPGDVNASLLVDPAEIELAAAVEEAEPVIRAAVEERRFDDATAAASALAPPVARFFDDVLVMAEDSALRTNRLRLLLDVRDALGGLGDLSQLPR